MKTDEVIKQNARYAYENFGIDPKLYQEVCEKFARSIKHGEIVAYDASMVTKIDTSFAVGFIVGYLIATHDVKAEELIK